MLLKKLQIILNSNSKRYFSKTALVFLLIVFFYSFGSGASNSFGSPSGGVAVYQSSQSGVDKNANSHKTSQSGKTRNSAGRNNNSNELPYPGRNRFEESKGKKGSGASGKKHKHKKKKNDKKNKKRKKSRQVKFSDTNGKLKLVTKKLGSAPLLKHFIDKMGVIPIIDNLVEKHPNRKISHGEAVAALLVYLLNDGRALYQMENWANENSLLQYLFPEYQPGDWTDDRLSDTLDAMYDAGLEMVQGSISGNIISEFSLKLSEIHYDTTSVSFWGTYDSATGEPAIVITFGYSKDHRPDLKQIVVGAAVSGDGGIPILSGVHDGNTNDSVLPIPYWEKLRKLTSKKDFCFIGDCKIASKKTIKEICTNEGKFLSPLPMSVKIQSDLINQLKANELDYEELELELEENLLPIYEHELYQKTSKQKRKEKQKYKVCEQMWEIKDDNGKIHNVRKLIVHGIGLEAKKKKTRDRHIEKAESLLMELQTKLNKRKLKSYQAIESKINNILDECKVKKLIDVEIKEGKVSVKKQIGKGRPGPNTKYKTEEINVYDIKFKRNENEIKKKALLDGIFILVTNHSKTEWPGSRLLSLYKRQYKVEKNFSTLKGPLSVTPMLLEKPHRICAMMFVMTIALQLYTLIQREAANELLKQNAYLEGLMPNNIKTCRPSTDRILSAFDNIMTVAINSSEKSIVGITSLNKTQQRILEILGVSKDRYSIDAFISKPGET